MATDLIGIDKVEQYIIRGKRHDFSIRMPNQNGNAVPIFESENSTAKNAADAFKEWAEIFSCDGNNNKVYEICLYDGDSDKNKNKSLKATFQLCEVSNRKSTADEKGNVIIQHPSMPAVGKDGMKKSDVDALISAAVEKVETNHLIQNLSAQIATLSRKLEEMDLEEEEEEEEEEEQVSIADPKTWTPDSVKEIIGLAKTTFLEIKGNGATITPGEVTQERKVAGPAEGEAVQLTQEDLKNPTLKPAYVAPPDNKDQNIKMNLAIVRLWKHDGHIGDDLMALADLADKNYDKFKGAILSLRDGDKKL